MSAGGTDGSDVLAQCSLFDNCYEHLPSKTDIGPRSVDDIESHLCIDHVPLH